MAHPLHGHDAVSRFRQLRHLAASALAVCAFTLSPSAPMPAASAATIGCAAGIGKNTPILFVHGFLGKPSGWTQMMQAVGQNVPHTRAEAFDYEKYDESWVDDPHIGPALAKTIACTAESSRAEGGTGKVIIVSHSMGGLATRYAAAQSVDGRPVSQDIGLVVNIGTPNLGSGLANFLGPLLYSLCDPATLPGSTPAASEDSPCAALSAIDALQQHSRELATLPKLPSDIPLMAIAGDETLTVSLFKVRVHKDTGSDIVVGKTSASYGQSQPQSGGGLAVVNCSTSVKQLASGSCFHTELTHNSVVEQATIGAIQQYIASIDVASALEPYVGTWYSPGPAITMTINADGHATFRGGADLDMTLKPNGAGVDGTITATVGEQYTGFHVGGTVSLKPAPDGGLFFDSHGASDGTEFYRLNVGSFVGTWESHSAELIVNPDGTGQLSYRLYGSCPHPSPPGVELFCGIVEQLRVAVTADGGVATITSSHAEQRDVHGQLVWTGSSGIQDGTSWRIAPTGTNMLSVVIDSTGNPYTVCRAGSVQSSQGDCGA